MRSLEVHLPVNGAPRALGGPAVDARVRILAALALVLASVSVPRGVWSPFAGYAVILLLAVGYFRIPLLLLARRYLVILPFVLMASVFIPFLNTEAAGLTLFFSVVLKAWVGASALLILAAAGSFSEVLQALERMRVPRLFLLLVGFTHRYLFVLVDEVVRMKRARDSRCYDGRWFWEAKVIGQIIGVHFLRSFERAERIYVAMLSRGYEGEFRAVERRALLPRDYRFIAAALALVVASRWGLTGWRIGS